jgi:hypothetical protein
LAITRVSGLCSQPDAKAFAQYQPKTHKGLAINACINGGFYAAKRRKSRPVEARRAGTNLMQLLNILCSTADIAFFA